MRRNVLLVALLVISGSAFAQELPQVDTTAVPAATPITLEQALQIALSQNASVRVADKEIERTGYAKKGTYSALYPQIDGNAAYQRTIKKQVMYMDFDIGSFGGGAGMGGDSESIPGMEDIDIPTPGGSGKGGGIEVGRWNTWTAGLNAAMPLVNAQLWESLKISDKDVELAVEKARGSRLETVNQVKQAYYAALLAKDAFNVYKLLYENAMENYNQTLRKYNAQRASELDLTRAKTNVANAIPAVYDAENSMVLTIWQLKAVMGIDLSQEIDVVGGLNDYVDEMLKDNSASSDLSLVNNTSLRQLSLQAEQLANTIKLQRYASIPSLALSFSFSLNAMTNDFKFSEFNWSPYSAVGLSLAIPIFSGGKRAYAVRQARVQAQELDIQRENTERQLRIAIQQSLFQMDMASKSYTAALSALESAQKAYSIASMSYNVGRSTLTDLNDAQAALTQAQLSVTQSIYSFVVTKATLENTLGADFIEESYYTKLNNNK